MNAIGGKASAYFHIYLTEVFAYRAAAFLWILADSITALVLPVVWIAAAGDKGHLGTMSVPDVVTYYVFSLVLSQFIISHMMWDIALEIREGAFTVYLLRPLSYFFTQFLRNVAWRIGKVALFLPVLALMLVVYWPYLGQSHFHIGPLFVLATFLGFILSFCNAFAVGIIALRTQECFAIIRLYYMPELFLSGRMFPLALMPGWVAFIANITPFRFTLSFPLELALGRLDQSAVLTGFMMQSGWIAIMSLIGWYLWRSGLKHYTGVGM